MVLTSLISKRCGLRVIVRSAYPSRSTMTGAPCGSRCHQGISHGHMMAQHGILFQRANGCLHRAVFMCVCCCCCSYIHCSQHTKCTPDRLNASSSLHTPIITSINQSNSYKTCLYRSISSRSNLFDRASVKPHSASTRSTSSPMSGNGSGTACATQTNSSIPEYPRGKASWYAYN